MSKPKYFHTLDGRPAFVASDGYICLLARDNRTVGLDTFLVDDLATIRRQQKASETVAASQGVPPSTMRKGYIILRDSE